MIPHLEEVKDESLQGVDPPASQTQEGDRPLSRDNPPSNDDIFDGIVLSGGGVRGIAELGALRYYEENGRLDSARKQIKVYIGTSIGSVLCLLLMCGYSAIDIFAKIYPLQNIIAFPGMSLPELMRIFSTYGFTTLTPLVNLIREMVMEKLGKIPTLRELYKLTNSNFIIAAGNISKNRGEYFSYKTNPNLGCIDAVQISCSLPLIFDKIQYRGDFYTDGGLTDHFPITHPELGVCSRVLGVLIVSSGMPVTNLFTYVYSIVSLCTASSISEKVAAILANPTSKYTIIKVTCEAAVSDSGMTSEKKMKLYLKGYEEAKMKESEQPMGVPPEERPESRIVGETRSSEGDGWDDEF